MPAKRKSRKSRSPKRAKSKSSKRRKSRSPKRVKRKSSKRRKSRSPKRAKRQVKLGLISRLKKRAGSPPKYITHILKKEAKREWVTPKQLIKLKKYVNHTKPESIKKRLLARRRARRKKRRGLCGFNLFVKDSRGLPLADIGIDWKSLSPAEKQAWNKKADDWNQKHKLGGKYRDKRKAKDSNLWAKFVQEHKGEEKYKLTEPRKNTNSKFIGGIALKKMAIVYQKEKAARARLA
jgi:hypothetical protein